MNGGTKQTGEKVQTKNTIPFPDLPTLRFDPTTSVPTTRFKPEAITVHCTFLKT